MAELFSLSTTTLPILQAAGGPTDNAVKRISLNHFFERINAVTVKLTAGCNLKCKYCNVDTVSPNTPRMSLAMWERISDLVVLNSRDKRLSIEFHGGEPLLLGIDFLVKAAAYTRNLGNSHGKEIDIPLVTNGVLLKPDDVDRLRDAGVGIAISCDGPPHINDHVRGGGLAVERALRLVHDKCYCDGVMTVMSEANYLHMYETMDWFRQLGVRDMAINCIQPQGRGISHGILDANQMYTGLMSVYRHMHETDASVVERKVAQQVERFVCGRPARAIGCWDFECQAGRSYVSIDLHGQIHACGSDSLNHILGRIDDGFIHVEHCKTKLDILHQKAGVTLNCFDCPARRICDHSCPTADYNSRAYAEAECLATRMTWKYFCDNPQEVRTVYNMIQRELSN